MESVSVIFTVLIRSRVQDGNMAAGLNVLASDSCRLGGKASVSTSNKSHDLLSVEETFAR